MSRVSRWLLSVVLLALPAFMGSPALASNTPLANGGFESGTLASWTQTGENGGFADVVKKGTCFGGLDTRGIAFSGTYAARVRSSESAPANSVGILTSDAFTATDAVSFKAIAETSFSHPNPSTLTVRILSAADSSVLSSTDVTQKTVSLNGGCPSTPVSATLEQAVIDTRAVSGRSVKVQFRQHTNYPGLGYASYIDDVAATRATALSAQPAVAQTTPLGVNLFTLRATLSAAGQGVAGRTVTFSAGGTDLCGPVTTDADGVATCDALGPQAVAVVTATGYSADFAGDDGYLPSTSSAPLIS